MSDKKKLWGGRFAGSVSEITERLTASIQYDKRLYRHDIRGSKAHARMLKSIGVLNDEELSAIIDGLDRIEAEITAGSFPFSTALEDIHMNIEARLTERIGDAGRKLHTARSRNDQVATDIRLYLKDELAVIRELLANLAGEMLIQAEKNIDTLLPGYTHLQIAQPVRFAQHLLAYVWQFVRDMGRLDFARRSADELPLGCGALAGVNYPNDREMMRKELDFSGIVRNSMDAVSDRDFLVDALYFSAVCSMHLSRLSEELVLWSSSEFGYIKLDDGVTTGSSIMPQKRNPDCAELIRGKTGRVYGNLMSMLTTLKGLPMTYNRDLQEDKEQLFDSLDTISLSLQGMSAMIAGMTVNVETMKKAVYRNYSTATDLADYLVGKGIPFRQCHEIVGTIVRTCEETGEDFFSLPLARLREFSPAIDADVHEIISPLGSTERKRSSGSTARSEVSRQITDLYRLLERQ